MSSELQRALWETANTDYRNSGHLAEPSKALTEAKWEAEVRKRVWEREALCWVEAAQGNSTLTLYSENKEQRSAETELYDNSLGSRLLFEEREGALRALPYQQRFDPKEASRVCRACGKDDETIEHLVLFCECRVATRDDAMPVPPHEDACGHSGVQADAMCKNILDSSAACSSRKSNMANAEAAGIRVLETQRHCLLFRTIVATRAAQRFSMRARRSPGSKSRGVYGSFIIRSSFCFL